MISAWTAMFLIMFTLALMIHFLGSLNRRFGVDEEIVRKALHVSMGTLTLSFPWLFHENWPVITLSIFSSILIAVIKSSGLKEWKSVLCAKGRVSIGEICFPISVGLLFILANGDKFLYLAPVAILSYADAASALIGTKYGRRKYLTVDGHKSQEGSITFFTVAFLATVFVYHLTKDISMINATLIGIIVALIATMFEAIAWRGLDNLTIPLGSYLALATHTKMNVYNLAESIAVLSIMFIAFIIFKRRSTLNGSAVVGVTLFCYFALLIAGPLWLLSPVVLFTTYKYLLPKRFQSLKSFHTIYGVIAVAFAGVLWLTLLNYSGDPRYLFPYTLTFGAHAAIISIAHMRFKQANSVKNKAILFAVLKSWCLICIPMMLVDPTPHLLSLYIFLAPFCIGIPTYMFYLVNSGSSETLTQPKRWFKQASFATLASAFGLIPLLI